MSREGHQGALSINRRRKLRKGGVEKAMSVTDELLQNNAAYTESLDIRLRF